MLIAAGCCCVLLGVAVCWCLLLWFVVRCLLCVVCRFSFAVAVVGVIVRPLLRVVCCVLVVDSCLLLLYCLV